LPSSSAAHCAKSVNRETVTSFTRGAFADTVSLMSNIEPIVEELKTLPTTKLADAANYIHRLKETSATERRAALENTAGILTADEADELARIIEEGCEQVDMRPAAG
jgi:hypothetical protein